VITRSKRLWQWLVARWHTATAGYKKIIKIAAAVGAIAAIVCHFVPKDYKQICDAIATLCGG